MRCMHTYFYFHRRKKNKNCRNGYGDGTVSHQPPRSQTQFFSAISAAVCTNRTMHKQRASIHKFCASFHKRTRVSPHVFDWTFFSPHMLLMKNFDFKCIILCLLNGISRKWAVHLGKRLRGSFIIMDFSSLLLCCASIHNKTSKHKSATIFAWWPGGSRLAALPPSELERMTKI